VTKAPSRLPFGATASANAIISATYDHPMTTTCSTVESSGEFQKTKGSVMMR